MLRTPALVLGALCVLLGVVIAAEIMVTSDRAGGLEVAGLDGAADAPGAVQALGGDGSGGAAAGAPGEGGAAGDASDEAVAGVLARPLFTPSRRPPDAPEQPKLAGPAGAVLNSRFEGVVITPSSRTALFLAEGQDHAVALVEGASIDGFKVKTIEAHRVILQSDQGEKIVQSEFSHSAGAAPGAAPRRRTPRPVIPPAGGVNPGVAQPQRPPFQQANQRGVPAQAPRLRGVAPQGGRVTGYVNPGQPYRPGRQPGGATPNND